MLSKFEPLIREMTHGLYDAAYSVSDAMHAGFGPNDTKDSLSDAAGRKQFVESAARVNAVLNPARQDEIDLIDEYYHLIGAQDNTPRDITRTEIVWGDRTPHDASGSHIKSSRHGKPPVVGDIIQWGIRSASVNPDFARLVALDKMPGIGSLYTTLADNGAEVWAYRVAEANRYVDVSRYSDYEQQQEVHIAGAYRVVNVSEEDVDAFGSVADEEIRESLQDHAMRLGGEICYKVSKRTGREVAYVDCAPDKCFDAEEVRAGGAVCLVGYQRPFRPVKIRWIDLEEEKASMV